MPSLKEILADKKQWPDEMKFAIGNGVDMSLGEMRQFQEATGRDLAASLEAEKSRLTAAEQAAAKREEEAVRIWTELEKEKARIAASSPSAQPGTDWTKDPFFAPIAEHLDKNVMSTIKQQAEQIEQFKKVLGLAAKYVTDVVSEQRYAGMPEEFRKEMPFEAALKTAADKKYLDSGGVPDVRKVYEEWQRPRSEKAREESLRQQIREELQTEQMRSAMPRPGSVPAAGPVSDPNAPKNLKDSFNRLKEDPEFLRLVYGNSGGAA